MVRLILHHIRTEKFLIAGNVIGNHVLRIFKVVVVMWLIGRRVVSLPCVPAHFWSGECLHDVLHFPASSEYPSEQLRRQLLLLLCKVISHLVIVVVVLMIKAKLVVIFIGSEEFLPKALPLEHR